MQGFVLFDPIYESGKAIGYLANILRTLGRKPYSLTDFIILEALERFREEEIRILSLGFSPFHAVEDKGGFGHSQPLHELFKFTYNHCNYLYAFQALAFHKDRYRPGHENTQQVKVYCATRHLFPVACLTEVFHKMGMNPVAQTREYAVKCLDETLKALPAELKKLANTATHAGLK